MNLNDLDDQEHSLDTNNGKPHGNESNQFEKSNVQTDHNIVDEIQDNAQINAVDDGASEQVSPNTHSRKHRVTVKPCVVMVGDSMIKHCILKKYLRRYINTPTLERQLSVYQLKCLLSMHRFNHRM